MKRFDECIDRIKQMSWGDLVEGGAHLGGDFLLNGASLCILKKLPSAGGKFVSGLKKFAEAGRAEETVAAANKGLSIANQVSMDTAIGVKLATEYGKDGAAKILKIIEQHPEILRQEGKTVIEVVQEVGSKVSGKSLSSSVDIVGSNFNNIKPTQDIVNREKVAEYVAKLKRGDTVSPIVIYEVPGKGKFIEEGHHRFVASQKTGIPVEIIVKKSGGPAGMSSWADVNWKEYISEDQFWG